MNNRFRERDKEKQVSNDGHFVNDQIRNAKVQVIDETGNNLGELGRREALDKAALAGLDLVKVGERDGVAIAKIMDFGKFLYEKKKQLAKSKKHQKVIQIKEIKLKPKIGVGDYTTKINQAAGFLEEGKHVKFTLQFKGRQPVSVTEVGNQFFAKIRSDLDSKNLGQLVEEKDSRAGGFWSKIFYIKGK